MPGKVRWGKVNMGKTTYKEQSPDAEESHKSSLVRRNATFIKLYVGNMRIAFRVTHNKSRELLLNVCWRS